MEAERLRPLVIGRAKPGARSGEELAGYRSALGWIYSRRHPLAITPEIPSVSTASSPFLPAEPQPPSSNSAAVR